MSVVLTSCARIGIDDDAVVAEHLELLCRFLAAQPTWDKRSAPDLPQLLTRLAVADFTKGVPVSPGSQQVYKAKLNHLVEAVAGPEAGEFLWTRAPIGSTKAFWTEAVAMAPLSALCAIHADRGLIFHVNSWRGLDLVTDLSAFSQFRGTAPAAAPSTVSYLVSEVATLRDVAGIAPRSKIGSNQGAKPGAAGSSSPRPKKVSRSASVRAARQAQRIRAEATENPPAPSGPRLKAIARDWKSSPYAEAIARYRPYDVDHATWEAIEDATRCSLAAYAPPSLDEMRNKACHLVRFLVWAQGLPERGSKDRHLELEELLVPRLADVYLDGPRAEAPIATRATARCVIRRVIKGLTDAPEPERFARTHIQAPYTPAECAEYVRLARNQPTAIRRRPLCALVGLGLGAGLDGREQKLVTPERCFDLELGDGTTALAIDLPGSRPRIVVVRAEYEPLVREALELHAAAGRRPDQPLFGNRTKGKNSTNVVVSKIKTATGEAVELSASRLRSTWLFAAMCSEVPLGVLLHASGLRSPNAFADLLPYCPDPDPARVAQLLRELEDTEPDTGEVKQ